ncbi:MAG: DUF433 domain-containing protein [Ignavibacteriae bacterium]|nr:DUF433 domain-containing protein [Ignavibacteriota bacterium]
MKKGASKPQVVRESKSKYQTFKRITFDQHIRGGQACIRGMRIPVSLVVSLVTSGMSVKELVKEYPDLEPGDIGEALRYAAWLACEEVSVS